MNMCFKFQKKWKMHADSMYNANKVPYNVRHDYYYVKSVSFKNRI